MTGGTVRFCTRCGRPVAEGTKFCTGCGNPLAQPGHADASAADTGQQSHPDDAPTAAGIPADATLPALGRVPPAPTAPAPGGTGEAGTASLAGTGRAWPVQDRDPPAVPPVHTVDPSPPYPPSWVGPPPERRTGRGSRLALIAVCTVVAVGAATAGGIVLAHRHGTAPSQAQSGGPTAGSHTGRANDGSQSPPPAPTTPTPPPSTTQPLASDTVTVGAAAAGNPQQAAVVSFLETYFGAINSRDYRAYLSLLGQQAQVTYTRRDFMRGYRSTSDSAEKLKRIYTIGGDTVAVVSFTSHQDPGDSINGQESCTRWRISLYLQPSGTGYTMVPALPGYHPIYAPCP